MNSLTSSLSITSPTLLYLNVFGLLREPAMVELKERLQGELGIEFSLSLNNRHYDVVRYRDKQVHVHVSGAADGGH